MITICEECGKKYRIDADKISGTEAKFKCKDCGHLITVSKPLAAPEAVKDATPVFPKFPELDNAKAVEKEPGPPQPPEAKKADKKKIRPAFMRPPKIRFGLTAKLFTMMIIVSLVPLSMFWGITLKQTRARMQTDAKKHFNQTSISIAKQIDEWLDNNARILKTLANMEDIISMNRLRQEPLLQVIHRVYPWIYFTATIDTKGMNIARNDDRPLLDYSNTNFFQEVIGGKPIAWQIVTEESSKNPAFFFAVPIIRHDEIVGVVANAVRLSDISKLMTFWGGDDTGTAFLVDQKGKVIAHKMTNYVLQQKSLLQHPLVAAYRNGQRGAVLFTGEGGNSILGHVRGTALGWILAIQQEEKEAYYIIEQLLSYAYLLLAVTIVFVFIIAWFSGRALSRPIIKLTDAADRISVGELDVEIDTNRKDEIGDLAEAVARMQDSIRLSIERLRQRR